MCLNIQKRIPEVFSGDAVQRRAQPPPHEREDDGDRQPLAEVTAEGQGTLQEDRRGEAAAVQSPAGAVARCKKRGLIWEGGWKRVEAPSDPTPLLLQSLSSQERNTYKEYNSQVSLKRSARLCLPGLRRTLKNCAPHISEEKNCSEARRPQSEVQEICKYRRDSSGQPRGRGRLT